MENHWLKCAISPGQFSGEYVVEAADFRGNHFSLFSPETFIECDAEPSEAGTVDGWLRVEKLAARDDLVLVRLPRTPLENGPTITVRANQLQYREVREPA
jgi:hypothetical protein